MFSSLWIKATLTLLLIALIVMGSCKMMKMAGCGGRKPRPPRPPRIVTVGPFDVLRVDSGASLTVKSGRRGERIVNLQYILIPPAPGPDVSKWIEVSRKHLEEMAGATVTVQYSKHGPFRSEPDTDREWDEWYAEHVKTCKTCSGAEGGLPPPLCEEAFVKMQEILRKGAVEIICEDCDGTGQNQSPYDGKYYDCFRCSADGKRWTTNPDTIEARGPLTGTVFGASGINLNLSQIEGGYCQCQPDAPKDWLRAEAEAKAKKRGIWSEK